MLQTHIYFNGNCKEAIILYEKAFRIKAHSLFQEDNLVIHAEINIHQDTLILNDFGDNDGISKSGGFQLCVRFVSKEDLEYAFSYLKEDCKIITPMQEVSYSPCLVRFTDKFGIPWAFYI